MFKLIKEGEVKFSEKVKTSPEAQDFLLKILNKNPKQRLGSRNDVEDILAHPWFKGIDREKMLKKEVLYPSFSLKLPSNLKSKETSGYKALTRNLLLNQRPMMSERVISNPITTKKYSIIFGINDHIPKCQSDNHIVSAILYI